MIGSKTRRFLVSMLWTMVVASGLASSACTMAGEMAPEGENLVAADEMSLTALRAYPEGSELRTTAALNLRTGPSTSNRIILVMPARSIVTLAASPGPTNGFYHVHYRTFEGYAAGQYMTLVASADAGAGAGDAGTGTRDAATGAGDTGSTSPDAGAGTTSGAWDPRSGRPPAGKGVWVWYFDRTGLSAAEVAQRCVRMGVGYVLIKSGQDASFWSTRYTAATVREFTSRGIVVFAWPYVTPRDVTGSIAATTLAAQTPGTSGVILDAEIEFEGSFARQAQQLCEGIRAATPGVFLGYTSFGWVGYHGTFPYSTFDRYCGDAFMPQVYWSDRGIGWSAGYTQAADMIRTSGLRAPVWMVESNDNTPSGSAPSTTDLNAFYDRAGAFTSMWEWPGSSDPTKTAQLGSLHWAN